MNKRTDGGANAHVSRCVPHAMHGACKDNKVPCEARAIHLCATLCTSLAIFAGMSATIWITVRSNMHALPALPLAIVLAFFSLFASRYLYAPYLDELFRAGILVV